MKAAPAVLKSNIPSLNMSEEELVRVLESSIYPGAAIESIKLAIGYCRANGLDPMQKPVHIVPMTVKIKGKNGEKDTYVKRDVIMPGVGLYRTQAARTKEYVGIDEAVFGDTKTLKIDEFELPYPEWCSIVVHRIVGELPRDFSSGKVYWLETYATAGNDTKAPNAMWKKRPFGQLEKCAEAMALRRAFPELGAAPTAEELEGKTFDHDDTPAPPALEGPRSKTPDPAFDRDDKQAAAASNSAAEPEQKKAGNGDKPMSPTQLSILKKSLERAALNELDLTTKFGVGLDALPASKFNEVSAWIAERAS